MPPILIVLLSLILLPAMGILLASMSLLRSYTLHGTPRSWRAAAGAGVIFTILLALLGAACSTLKPSDPADGGDGAFAVFSIGAIFILILLSYLLMVKNKMEHEEAEPKDH